MTTLVFSHVSALRALRKARTKYHGIPWEAASSGTQRRLMAQSAPNRSLFDSAMLNQIGVVSELNPKAHVLVGTRANRRWASNITCHLCLPSLPKGSLLRIDAHHYCCSPALTALQCSAGKTVPEILVLLLELLGTFSLPAEATDPIAWGGQWPDHAARDSVEQVHYACDPAVTIPELRALSRWARGERYALFRHAVRLATTQIASPAEAIMYGMFAAPMRYGGFNMASLPRGGMLANHRIDFTGPAAHVSGGIPYAICDIYIPSAKVDLEYNGAGHEETNYRMHDDNRNNGLKAMGIQVFALGRAQMRDIVALEAMARVVYKRAGIRYRYRIKGYRLRQGQWLNGLRRGIGLPPT